MLRCFIVLFFPFSLIASQPPWQNMPPAPERVPAQVIARNTTTVEEFFAQRSSELVARQASTQSAKSNDTVIHMSTDSEGTEDTIPKRHHNRRMLISNGTTAIVVALITAGVTLTIHFTDCKK